MSEYLPDETDFYAEHTFFFANEGFASPTGKGDSKSLLDENGLDLPFIGKNDFTYYPESVTLPSMRSTENGSINGATIKEREVEEQETSSSAGLLTFVRKVFVKLGIRKPHRTMSS